MSPVMGRMTFEAFAVPSLRYSRRIAHHRCARPVVSHVRGRRALIYPSARNEVVCFYNQETLVEWSGWNLVDYRGAPEPDLGLRLIVDPDSWWLLTPRMDVQSLLDPENRGSWLIRKLH